MGVDLEQDARVRLAAEDRDAVHVACGVADQASRRRIPVRPVEGLEIHQRMRAGNNLVDRADVFVAVTEGHAEEVAGGVEDH